MVELEWYPCCRLKLQPASWFHNAVHKSACTELKNVYISVTVQNRTHVYMNFFDHKDLVNHLLQLCPKVVNHPVYYIHTNIHTFHTYVHTYIQI